MKPKLKLISELPLGTRFRYPGIRIGSIWVLLDRVGVGLCARWEGADGPVAGQTVVSVFEYPEDAKTVKLEIVEQ